MAGEWRLLTPSLTRFERRSKTAATVSNDHFHKARCLEDSSPGHPERPERIAHTARLRREVSGPAQFKPRSEKRQATGKHTQRARKCPPYVDATIRVVVARAWVGRVTPCAPCSPTCEAAQRTDRPLPNFRV
jgi:hypothetical protein